MNGYTFDWSIIWQNGGFLAKGLFYTLALTFIACVAGSILAVPLALALRSSNRFAKWIGVATVEIGKGVPLLVLLVWIHYVMPNITSWPLDAFWNSCIAFSFNLAAFMADVLRGGANAIPRGHIEAAQAVGMSWQAVRYRVVIPETIRRTLPTIVAFYISTLKFSTLAAFIGVSELLFTSRMINAEAPRPLELYTALAVVFAALVIPMSSIGRLMERHPWFAITPKSGR